jgi:S-DNA-T family DNA segregation ATPase FtsK/SpoIIIE
MARKQKEPLIDSIEAIDNNKIERHYQTMPSIWWFVASFPTILFTIFSFVALVTYDWHDVSALNSNGNPQVLNLMGVAGANFTYLMYVLFGLSAWTIPFWFLICSIAFFRRERLAWRFLWMLVITLSLSALFQIFFKYNLTYVLSEEWLNIAPNGGGVFGYLLSDLFAYKWFGLFGLLVIFIPLLIAGIIFMIGLRRIGCYILALRSRISAARELDKQEREELRKREREQKEDARLERQRNKAEQKRIREERRREKEESRSSQSSILIESMSNDSDTILDSEFDGEEQNGFGSIDTEEQNQSPEDQNIIVLNTDDEDSALISSQPQPKTSSKSVTSFKQEVKPELTIERHNISSVVKGRGGVVAEASERKKSFSLPSTSILAPAVKPSDLSGTEDEIKYKSQKIEDTLAEFRIKVNVFNVVSGPVITCYELKPEVGVRVENIARYANNLQMTLEAKSMRILSPIPGKNAIGIEVPNNIRRPVNIREVAESPEWKEKVKSMAIPMLLGEDVSGKPVIADLAKMPHMLVAGTTGSGKSVCLNSILAGFMLCRTPEDLRLIMVDPKKVEFTPYADLPHLIVPIITEAKKVAASLQWAIAEMNRRLDMFRKAKVRNIAGFNNREKAKQTTMFGLIEEDEPLPDKLPYIVIVIDEMADLMLSAKNDVEPRIVRLAQLSRAVGIHMILATQRPSVNVITGTIKANFPARIGFKVSQRVDSVTILDQVGAEHLIGYGDMLFCDPSQGSTYRGQGCWISDQEVEDLVNAYKKQGEPIYVAELKEKLDGIVENTSDGGSYGADTSDGASGGDDSDDGDTELMRKALEYIAQTRRASTSSIQRTLRIGFNRAARIMDELEARGCIGPANGSGPREILRTTLEPTDDIVDEE